MTQDKSASPSPRPSPRDETPTASDFSDSAARLAKAQAGGDEATRKFADAREMGFFEHLDELRVRLIRCLWIFMIGFGLAYWVSDPIFAFLKEPLFTALRSADVPEPKLIYTGMFENFMVHLKIAGVASLFVFSPYFFYELWAFVAPGLYPKERKLVVPFITAATMFFIGGAAFAYYVLFPVGFKFFVTYGDAKTEVAMISVDNYFSTVLKLLVLFGLAFETPVLITLFGYLGLVDAPMLRRQRKPAIIVMAVISALFAPPDALSMIILLVPLVLMYEMAIVAVSWIGLKRAARFAAEEAAAKGSGSDSDPSKP